MLSHCANSKCSKPFLNLREGKLFVVEADGPPGSQSPGALALPRVMPKVRKLEHYWLCDECAVRWTLIYDQTEGIEMIPRRKPMHTVPLLEGIHGAGKAPPQIVPPGA
jgi:hypothetical protein